MVAERTTVADAPHLLALVGLDEVQFLQDSLAAVGGLRGVLTAPDGQPLARLAPVPALCRLVRQCREPGLLCVLGGGQGQSGLGEGPIVARCPALGLLLAAVPLHIEGRVAGAWVCGPALDVQPTEAWVRERTLHLRLADSALRTALQEIPVLEERRFRALVTHAAAGVGTLARLAEARWKAQRYSRHLQMTNQRLGALGAVAASIIRSPTLPESLSEALQTILDVLGLESGAVFLWGEEDGAARLVAHRGVGPAFVALAASRGLAGPWRPQALKDSFEPWVVPDVAREPDLPAALQQLQIGAFVAVPLRTTDGAIGTLWVHASEPRAFRPDELALLTAAGEQLGVGVQGLRLLAAEKRRAGELAALNEVAVAVSRSLDVQVIAEEALDTVLRLFRAGAGMVYLLGEEAQRLSLVAHRGLSGGFVREWATRPPLEGDGEHGIDNQARWGADLSAACARHDLVLAEGLVSYISAPLRGQRRTAGLLVAFTREPRSFSANEADLFQAAAHEVGLALENAQLYREAQRRLAELEALQQFNERILHTMQEGIFIISTNGQVSYATPRLAELTGYTVEEIVGKDWSAFVRPEVRETLQQTLEVFQSGRSVRQEVDLVRKDGRTRHVSLGAVPLFDGGQFAGLLGVATDLTEEVQLRRRLQQAERLSAVGELVSGVAHELNNPLTVIRGYAQLLQGREEARWASRELGAITEHAERAACIVRGLLTFAREHPPAYQEVDLNAVLQSVLDMRGRQLVTSGIRVVLELAPDLPRIWGDPYQLQQVFLNVLLNAEQALAETGRGGEVRLRTTLEADGSVLAIVQDDGPGIRADIADQIFDPFFTTKGDHQGTGLGLSICYGIVNAHGGRIWAESTEGHGATFYVSLPASAPVPPAPTASREQPEREQPPPGRRLLILEDEAEIAQVMARYLERLGYHVVIAHEAQAALDALEQQDFDLILTDLKMPGMNGQEFYAHLCRNRPPLARRVLFVTGDTVSPDTQRCLSRSGRPLLAKPFSLDEMHSLVASTLSELEVRADA